MCSTLSLSIHLLMDIYVGSTHYGDVASINKDVQVCLCKDAESFKNMTKSRIAESYDSSLVIAWETSMLIPKFPQAMNKFPSFPVSSLRSVVIWFFHLIHSHFHLLFTEGYHYCSWLEIPTDHSYFLFRKFGSFHDPFIDWPVFLVFHFFGSLYIWELIFLSEA